MDPFTKDPNFLEHPRCNPTNRSFDTSSPTRDSHGLKSKEIPDNWYLVPTTPHLPQRVHNKEDTKNPQKSAVVSFCVDTFIYTC